MAGWGEFVAAYALFMASHAIPARPAVRARFTARLGERGYRSLYSLISLALLAWLIVAAGRTPYVPIWPAAPWQAWVPASAMTLVCLLVAFAVGAPNPLSFGGAKAQDFDPDRPGIVGVARHPLLWAIALWAGSHLVANGDLAHGVLFGGFFVFALTGMVAIDRRRRRALGADDWDRLAARTSIIPLASLLDRRWHPSMMRIGPRRLAAAIILYGALVASHAAVIGVSPVPVLP